MAKINKSISINPQIVLDVEDLINAGRVSSFSWLAEEALKNAIRKYMNMEYFG